MDDKPTTAWLPIPPKTPVSSGVPQNAESVGTPVSSYTNNSRSSSYTDSPTFTTQSVGGSKAKGKGKAKAAPSTALSPNDSSTPPSASDSNLPQTPPPPSYRRRRSSHYFSSEDDGISRPPLLSPTFAAREELCVNVGTDEHPRLVSLVTATQGYEFNRALFLPPRFMRGSDFDEFRDRDTEVVDVFVSEEESRAILMD